MRGQFLGHVSGEKTGVGEGKPVDLLMHRREHGGVPVAQTGHCSPARCVKVLAAFAVDQPGTMPRHRDRRVVLQMTMEDVSGWHESESQCVASIGRAAT